MSFDELVKAGLEADPDRAQRCFQQIEEGKTAMVFVAFEVAGDYVRRQVKKENPFATEAQVKLKFIEHAYKADYEPGIFAFIEKTMGERSEAEWKQRFKKMKKSLGWSYDQMARYMEAGSGNAVKSSVARGLPAFAKLAVCVFEQMQAQAEESRK